MLDKIAHSVRTFFTPDRLSITICLLLASIGWFLTKMSKEYSDQLRFHIHYQLPNEQTFSFNPPSTIEAEIRAKGWSLLRLALGRWDDTITLDQTVIHNGTVSSRLLLSENLKSVASDELIILNTIPEQVDFKLVERQRKKVPVRLDGELVLSGQYQWKDAYIFNPDSVNIFGPQDKLNSIESWPTIPYIRTDIDEDFQDVIALRSEAPAITTEVRDVILTAHVDQVTEKEIFVPIPLADSLKNKIRIFPAEVLVKITLGLSQYDQVSSEDFKLQLLEDTSMANRRKVVVSKLPNSVRYVSHTPEYVDYYRSIIESSDDAK